MSLTRFTVRNVDQDVIDRVRLHIRKYGLSLGDTVTAALADHLSWIDYMTGKRPGEAGLDLELPARLEQVHRGLVTVEETGEGTHSDRGDAGVRWCQTFSGRATSTDGP